MKNNIKSRAVKLFLIFLGAMLAMTFVSRMVTTEKMPVVTTEGIKESSIVHKVKCSGSLTTERQTPVFVAEGLRVAEVFVKQGGRIGKGAHLMRLDKEYIADMTAAAEKELAEFMENGSPYSGSKTPVFTQSGLRVAQVCVRKGDTVYGGQVLMRLDTDHLLSHIRDMEDELAADRLSRDGMYEAEDQRSAEALSLRIDEKQRELDRYNAVYNSGGAVCSPIAGVVTDMAAGAGDMTTDQAVALVSSSPELSSGAEQLRRRIDALKEAAEHEGYINSPVGGLMTEVNLRAGDMTAETAAFIISDESSGKIFSGMVDPDEVKYISVGDKVNISFSGGKQRLKDCEVTLLTGKDGDGYRIEAAVDSDDVKPGENGEMTKSCISEERYTCLPVDTVTLSGDNSGSIFYLEETEGFLGKQYVVHTASVKIVEENDNVYAVTDFALPPDTKLVRSSSKKLAEGMKVRKA